MVRVWQAVVMGKLSKSPGCVWVCVSSCVLV